MTVCGIGEDVLVNINLKIRYFCNLLSSNDLPVSLPMSSNPVDNLKMIHLLLGVIHYMWRTPVLSGSLIPPIAELFSNLCFLGPELKPVRFADRKPE